MKNMNNIVWIIVAAFVLSACGEQKVTLAPEVVDSMTVYADRFDEQYPDTADMNIARQCATEPTGLYWNESIQTWAVVCVMSSNAAVGMTYGVVLLDTSHQVLSMEHINAMSQADLEDLIRSVGWVRK